VDDAAPTRRDDGEVTQTRRHPRGVLALRDLLIIFVLALLISMGLKAFVVRSFYIPSASMNPTLVQNDRVLVNLLVPEVVPLEHGDVVVFQDPDNWLNTSVVETPVVEPPTGLDGAIQSALRFVGFGSDNNDHLIKRVIGLPGDTVECCDNGGQLMLNGIPIVEPYIAIRRGETKAAPEEFDVTVPEGTMWVMGDNRYNSGDSAFHRDDESGGFVPLSEVDGRAFIINWPFNRVGILGNYPDSFDRMTRGGATSSSE
jgi:signal peptidase I